MELTFTFDADKDLLRAALDGSYSLSDAETRFLDILDAAALHQAKKVLIDCRAITGVPTTMERFYYSEFIADKTADIFRRGLTPPLKFAYILVPPVVDPQKFGEAVAKNRGMKVKVFENLGEAEHWLEEAVSRA